MAEAISALVANIPHRRFVIFFTTSPSAQSLFCAFTFLVMIAKRGRCCYFVSACKSVWMLFLRCFCLHHCVIAESIALHHQTFRNDHVDWNSILKFYYLSFVHAIKSIFLWTYFQMLELNFKYCEPTAIFRQFSIEFLDNLEWAAILLNQFDVHSIERTTKNTTYKHTKFIGPYRPEYIFDTWSLTYISFHLLHLLNHQPHLRSFIDRLLNSHWLACVN